MNLQKHYCWIIVSFLFLFFSLGVQSQNIVPIQFTEGDWEEVKALAQEEGKMIFVEVTSVYCPPCRWMEKNVFTQEEVGLLFNKYFVNYKVTLEEEVHEKLLEKWNINSAPALLFFTENGHIVNQKNSLTKTKELLEIANKTLDLYKDIYVYYRLEEHYEKLGTQETTPTEKEDEIVATDAATAGKGKGKGSENENTENIGANAEGDIENTLPISEENIAALKKANLGNGILRLFDLEEKYKAGNLKPHYLREYAYYLKQFHLPFNIIVDEYLKTQKQKIASETNRQFVYDFTLNLENDAIDYFVNNIGFYKKAQEGKKVHQKVRRAVLNSIMTAIENRDKKLFEKALWVIENADLSDGKTFAFHIKTLYYQGIGNWKNYTKIVSSHIEKNTIEDPRFLSECARKFYKYTNKKSMLKKALKWAEKSLSIEDEYYNNYTYAGLLFRLGKKSKALAAIQHTIDIGQRRKEDVSEAVTLQERIQNSKK